VSHIPGCLIVLADSLSRSLAPVNTEWGAKKVRINWRRATNFSSGGNTQVRTENEILRRNDLRFLPRNQETYF
jgi:hypothetical protein